MPQQFEDFLRCRCSSGGTSSSAKEFSPSTEITRRHYAPDLLIHSRHIKICLHFDIPASSITATVVHTFRCVDSVGNASPCTLDLNAVGFMDVSVRSLTENQSVSAVNTGKLIQLHWSNPFSGGEERLVEIKYRISKPVSGMFFFHPTEEEPGVVSHVITDHETEKARYWLPCVDYPSSRSTLEFELTAPAHMIALANGSFVKETIGGDGLKTTFWRLTDYLCPSYLICIAVGEFERVVDTAVDGIPVEYYAPKGYPAEDIRRAFEKTPSMIKWLQKKLDSKFPWPKYFQIASPGIGGGAMENISLVTWSHRFIMDEVWAKEFKLPMDTVNIHEMAHTYFGDLIVIRHFDQVWLKESWATYMESVWIEDHLSREDFEFEMFENAESYFAEAESYLRPLVTRKYESSWTMYDSHTYPGGCWRIHQLRRVLGDELFWSGVRKYVCNYRDKVVETSDFRKIFESESGLNLTRFFEEWFYSKGYPKLKASYEYKKERRQVLLTLEQAQVDKKAELPLFHIDFDVKCTDAKGAAFFGKITFDDNGRDYNSNKAWTVVQLGEHPPHRIQIDPQCSRLFQLDFNPGEELLGNIAAKADDVPNRIRAHRELIKIGTSSAMLKVEQAILAEKYHGVHSYVAMALGEARTRQAVDLLCKMLTNSVDPKSTWRIAKSCIGIRDVKLRSALLRFLKRNDLAYRARAFGLEALGYQANEEDLSYILQVVEDPNQLGYHNVVRCGALRALGHSQQPESFEYLFKQWHRQPYLHARAAAIEALARAASWQDSPAIRRKTLQTLLAVVSRDTVEANRKAAIQGLVLLEGAGQSADAVWESRVLYPEQDWPELKGKVDALRCGKGTAVELKKRVDDLEEQVKRLQGRLQELEQSSTPAAVPKESS